MTPLEQMQWAEHSQREQEADNNATADSAANLMGYLWLIAAVLIIGGFILKFIWQSLQSTAQAWHDFFISVGAFLGLF